MARVTKTRKPAAMPATPLEAMMHDHLQSLAVQNYSEHTVRNRRVHIGFFLEWCKERGLSEPV
jgi:integrase/recombinase XerD